jgi:galactose oxidase-like protein
MAMRLVAWLALTLLGAPALAQQAHWQLLDPGDLTHPTARSAHVVALDAPGRRVVAWGDAIPVGEVWTMALDGPAVWTRVPTQGTPPPARVLGSAIYDPVRRRMVIFGGGVYETTIAYRDDVWALQLDGVPTWTQLLPAGPLPDPRQMHAAIYDAPRDRMIVFGGISSQDPPPNVTRENSVWALSLGDSPQWTRLAPTGTPPPVRQSPSMVFDVAGDRAVVFGGANPLDYSMPYLSDAWALSLGGTPAWTRLLPAGTPPSPRYEHVAVMDDARRRMLVFAGRGLNLISTNDTYALSLGPGTPAWTNLGAATVTPRYSHAAVLDPVTDRLIVDGGAYGDYRLVETIALPLGGTLAWQTLSPVGIPPAPPARSLAAPLVDPVTDQLWIQGGQDFVSTAHSPNDLWSWPLGSGSPAWTRLRENLPGDYSAVILDPVRRRQVRFFRGPTGVEAMRLDVPGDWTPVNVAGTPPPARYDYSLAYDPVRDRILLSGGYMDSPLGHSRHLFVDIWALSLPDPPTWQAIRPDDGLGLALFADALFYDVRGDRLLGVGAWSGIGAGAWGRPGDGSSDWTPIGIGLPTSGSAVYDPASEEIIVLQLDRGTAWHLPVDASAGWQLLTISGDPPPPRSYARLAFDGARRRILVFGGSRNSGGVLDDLWALQLDLPVPVAVSLASSDARPDGVRLLWWSSFSAGTVATLETRRGEESWHAIAELVTDGGGRFGYEDRKVSPGERVGYRLVSRGTPWPASEVWVTVPQRATLALAGARPNPAVDAPMVVFSLASDSPARLELFDLAGRRLATREVGALGAGEHQLRIGESLAPGLYVARLAQQGKVVTARFAVAR